MGENPEMVASMHDPRTVGPHGRHLLSILDEKKLRRILEKRKFQDDPHWRDHVLFYEYFHGDNGAGLGASHQTGWTDLIAPLMNLFAHSSSHELLERGRAAAVYREGKGKTKS